MAPKLSKEDRRKISEQLEREEEARILQKKLRDEAELRKLTTQTRLIKNANEVDEEVVRNTKVKDILVQEKDTLEDGLKMMKSVRRCVLDNKQAQDIANLFAQGDDLDAAIQKEKKYIADLEFQIRNDTQNIQHAKKMKGSSALHLSDHLSKKEQERSDRTLESWTTRLHAEQQQLALVIKQNEDMRSKIRRLIKEKGIFNKLFGELMSKLTKGKVIMADVVERSRQQFQMRDEVYRKIEALQSRDKADLAKRMEEMQELEQRLYEDEKLMAFRNRIQTIREKLDEMERLPSRKTSEGATLFKSLELCKDYWKSIQDATDLTSADEICKHIVHEDAELFAMFNFNNEIHDQLVVLTNKITELVTKTDEETFAAESFTDDCIRKIHNMEKLLEKAEHMLNDVHDFYEANERLFFRLLDKIKMLFDMAHCDASPLQELLGDNMKVTEHNFKLYLGLLETKVIELMEHANPGRSITAVTSGGTIASHKATVGTIVSTQSSQKLNSTNTVNRLPVKRVVTQPCKECEKPKRKTS